MASMPQSPEPAQQNEIASPCTGVCKLDAHSVCLGCFRSIEEIMAWPTASAALRTKILGRCLERKEQGNG